MNDQSEPGSVSPDPIGDSPLDLYRRLGAAQRRLSELVHEISDIQREYQRLRAHPAALDVDDLGKPIDPVVATDAVIHALDHSTAQVTAAHDWVEATRSGHAMRLRLTPAVAAELSRRRNAEPRTTLRSR